MAHKINEFNLLPGKSGEGGFRMPNNTQECVICGRRRNQKENVFVIVCYKYDMSAFMQALERCYSGEVLCDYLVIEPYTMRDFFSEDFFYQNL